MQRLKSAQPLFGAQGAGLEHQIPDLVIRVFTVSGKTCPWDSVEGVSRSKARVCECAGQPAVGFGVSTGRCILLL